MQESGFGAAIERRSPESPTPPVSPGPIHTHPSPADLLEQLNAQLAKSLFATVSGAIAKYEMQ